MIKITTKLNKTKLLIYNEINYNDKVKQSNNLISNDPSKIIMLSALIKPVNSTYFSPINYREKCSSLNCRFCFAVRLKFLLRKILWMFSHLTFFSSEWHVGSVTLHRFVDVGENIENETLSLSITLPFLFFSLGLNFF